MAENYSNIKSGENGESGSGPQPPSPELSHHQRSSCCFKEWMQVQEQDLSHLTQTLSDSEKGSDAAAAETDIAVLVRDCFTHFEDYVSRRNLLAEEDVSTFFAPPWCTSLENSLLWITGCRPSIFIRLLYALSGTEAETRLSDFLKGTRTGNLCVGDLSREQFVRVNSLRMKTVKEEEKLSSEMASLQEEIADQPIAVIVTKMSRVGEASEEANKALKEQEKVKKGVMVKADELRLKTLNEVMAILKPVQAAEFLIASKKLHLTIHQWGKWKDENHGRTT